MSDQCLFQPFLKLFLKPFHFLDMLPSALPTDLPTFEPHLAIPLPKLITDLNVLLTHSRNGLMCLYANTSPAVKAAKAITAIPIGLASMAALNNH
ncbi:hypothetical protein IMAU10574_02862 [Lactiplantibacillus plantarum]|nr:hypothetical protein [Lactiplantibacillus plantarum]